MTEANADRRSRIPDYAVVTLVLVALAASAAMLWGVLGT